MEVLFSGAHASWGPLRDDAKFDLGDQKPDSRLNVLSLSRVGIEAGFEDSE